MSIIDSLVQAVTQVIIFTVIPFFVRTSDMATSQFSGLGSAAIGPGLVYAFVQTGLSEELLFRGFLTKRLTNRFGFLVGWLMGYINERQSDGSIVSSWLVHGGANTLAVIIAAFSLVQ